MTVRALLIRLLDRRFVRAAVTAFLLCVVVSTTGQAQDITDVRVGVISRETAMRFLPNADRTPIRTLPVGARVRVIGREKDWYKVVYTDPKLLDLHAAMELLPELRLDAEPERERIAVRATGTAGRTSNRTGASP